MKPASSIRNLSLSILLSSAALPFVATAGIVCGDSILSEDQVNFPEDCDTGENATLTCNNNTDPAGGDGPCMFTVCGDGITQNLNGVGFPEDCDDSGASATCSDICETIAPTTTTTAAGTTTTTAAGTTTTTAAGTTTTTIFIPTTTTTTAAATTTTAAATTTTTTMGGGPTTTTTATPTTTSTTASSSTTSETTTTTLPPSSGESVTVPVEGGDTVTITTESGETVSDVSTSAVTDVPRGMEFPFGAISYTTTSPKGGTVTMRFKFSSDLPKDKDLAIFKIGKNGNKTRLPKKLWTKVNARTLDVDVTDGDSLTDQDRKKNGKIKDPMAVASDPDTFDFGGGGCTLSNTQSTSMDPIWLFLLVAPGLGLLRRRRVATDCARSTSS